MDSKYIKATSLSSVLELADNPPLHPTRQPFGTAPLTLYIARVPGSRDVFLTPMKPREKIVTAEDVQSSLYYVHINSEADYEGRGRPSSANSDASQLLAPPQKPKKIPPPLPTRRTPPPLPKRPGGTASPPYPVDDPMPALPVQPPSPTKATHIARKPVLSDITNSVTSHPSGVDLPILPPRPLPPTPDEAPFDDSLHKDNIRLLRSSSHLDEHNNPYTRNYTIHPETLKQQDIDSRPEPGSLTLIRRDPGQSTQFNVARIHDPPVHEVSSTALLVPTAKRRTKKGGAPMYLDITNPGYAPFITSLDRPQSPLSISSFSSSSDSSEPPPEGVFRRRLYMPGSQYADHSYGANGHRKFQSVSSASGESDFEIPKMMRMERRSVDLGSPTTADKRSKGYTFSSPWNGRCEFTTGATGRSLKCKHHLAGNQNFPDNFSSGSSAEEVSELRFNLPTSSSPSKKTAAMQPGSYFRKYSEDGSASPTIVLAEDGSIDLTLGQERAGGGFGGKQAKLGKLIVQPAGLPMLDLLVAANLGLWWRAYERY